ncbi:colicin-like pore-forming protein [Serratia ureilytica]|uniref:colicin-like pore-forming protein n=1 Tax=Serratia ureilytica TaxID=300181 RepID=UPI00313DC106
MAKSGLADSDGLEWKKMLELGYEWNGESWGWPTTGVDTPPGIGDTEPGMTVWPSGSTPPSGYTNLNGYGTNYVAGRPDSLGVAANAKKAAQFEQDLMFFQNVESDASQKLEAARQRMRVLSDEASRLTGADKLRKEAEQAVASVDEMAQEITLDEAKANKLNADFEVSFARWRENPRDVRLDGDRQKRLMDERDALRNGIPVKQSEKDLRVARLNKLMADVAALDAGQDVREVNAARELEDVRNQANALEQERQRLEGEVSSKNAQAAHEREEEARNLALKEKIVTPGDALSLEQRKWEEDRWNDAQRNKAEAERLSGEAAASQGALNDVNRRLGEARSQESQKQQQLNDVQAQIAAEKAEAARRQEEQRQREEAARKAREEAEKLAREAKEREEKEIQDAVKFTADFYKEVFKVYGEKAEKLAKLLADQAKGKNVRNVNDALKAYDKYKANINKKINKKDREAIAKALESVDVKQAARNISKFGKGLGYTSLAIDAAEWAGALKEAIETDNWRPFFVKTEAIAAGMAASAVTGFAFSIILGGPVGLLGYSLIMAGVGALIDDDAMEQVNKFIGI